MTPREDHQRLLDLIGQSCASGARLHKACAVIGLDSRTVWPIAAWETGGPKTQQTTRTGDHRAQPDLRLGHQLLA